MTPPAGLRYAPLAAVLLATVLLAACDTIESGTATPAQPTSVSTTATGSEGEAALAAELGFDFADSVNRGDLAAAFNLICAQDREDLTLEQFSEDAPSPGSVSFVPGELIGPGVYSGVLMFDGEPEAVEIESNPDGIFCISQPD